jgi:hypothetical protein
MRQGLKDFGYVEGRNIDFQYQWAARVIAAGYRVSGFVVCPACSIAWE